MVKNTDGLLTCANSHENIKVRCGGVRIFKLGGVGILKL